MPTAVAHILVPLLLGAIIRDRYLTKKKRASFSLHYVLIAGIGGVLPDIDILVFLGAHYLGYTFEQVHRTILHSLLIPGGLLILSMLTKPFKNSTLSKQKLTLPGIFGALAFGTLIHIVLDWLIIGQVHPFAPFSSYATGLNLIAALPAHIQELALPLLDGILVVAWIIYLEVKHKISDFI